jgi:hypothetical protein
MGATAATVVCSLGTPLQFGTAFAAGPLGRVSGDGRFTEESFTVVDSVAPVAVRARYHPGAPEGADLGRAADTLTVLFSEGVTWLLTDDEPFALTHGDTGYTFVLEPVSGQGTKAMRYAVKSITGGMTYPVNGDSLRLVAGEFRDEPGRVVQSAPGNRRVALEVKYPEVRMDLAVSPNPFNPGDEESLLPDRVVALLNDLSVNPSLPTEVCGLRSGFVARVEMDAALPSQMSSAKGSMTIYDVVANVIRSDVPIVRDPGNRTLYLIWDGRNAAHRLAGSGTYLAVIAITDGSGTSRVFRQLIGVLR